MHGVGVAVFEPVNGMKFQTPELVREILLLLGGLLSASLPLPFLDAVLGSAVASSRRLARAVLDREEVFAVGGGEEEYVAAEGC